jgi:ketosteroid isomerase-like protein
MVKASNENEQVYLNFFETLSSGDLEKIRAAFHDEAVWQVQVKGNSRRGLRIEARRPSSMIPRAGARHVQTGDPKVTVTTLASQGRWSSVSASRVAHSRMAARTKTSTSSSSRSRTARSGACASTWDSFYIAKLQGLAK